VPIYQLKKTHQKCEKKNGTHRTQLQRVKLRASSMDRHNETIHAFFMGRVGGV
jgi:hypothetical protein